MIAKSNIRPANLTRHAHARSSETCGSRSTCRYETVTIAGPEFARRGWSCAARLMQPPLVKPGFRKGVWLALSRVRSWVESRGFEISAEGRLSARGRAIEPSASQRLLLPHCGHPPLPGRL